MGRITETEREGLERRYLTLKYPEIFFGWENNKRRDQTIIEFRRRSKAIRRRQSYRVFDTILFIKHPKVPLSIWVDCISVLDKANLFAYRERAMWIQESLYVAYEDVQLKKINDKKLRIIVFGLEI